MKRGIYYIIGLNLIAFAVVLNIRYGLGVAAFSSVMYAISEIYYISLGTASIICLKGQHFIQYGGNKKRENTT